MPQIPILVKLEGAYVAWHNCFVGIPKISQYTLGNKVDSLLLSMIQLILFASYSQRSAKLGTITKASVELDAIKFFLRLLWKVRAIDEKKYITLSKLLNDIGKMLGGWMKSLKDTKEG